MDTGITERKYLSDRHIDLLIDAVEVWESRHANSDFLGTVMTTILAKDEDTARKTIEERLNKRSEIIRNERDVAIELKYLLTKIKCTSKDIE